MALNYVLRGEVPKVRIPAGVQTWGPVQMAATDTKYEIWIDRDGEGWTGALRGDVLAVRLFWRLFGETEWNFIAGFTTGGGEKITKTGILPATKLYIDTLPEGAAGQIVQLQVETDASEPLDLRLRVYAVN